MKLLISLAIQNTSFNLNGDAFLLPISAMKSSLKTTVKQYPFIINHKKGKC